MSDEDEEISADFSASEDEWKPDNTKGGESSDDDDSDFEEEPVASARGGGVGRGSRNVAQPRGISRGAVSKKKKPTGQSLRSKLFNKYRPPPKTVCNSPSASTSRSASASKNARMPNESRDDGDDDSSSDSSIDNYLVDPKDIDIRDSYFNISSNKEKSPAPIFDCNAGMKNLSDSGSEDDNESSTEDRKALNAFDFRKLLENANSLEKAKEAMAKRAAENKMNESSSANDTTGMDIQTLLALGEKNSTKVDSEEPLGPSKLTKTKSTRIKRHTKTRPSSALIKSGAANGTDSDEDEFEEVAGDDDDDDDDLEETTARGKDLEIVVEMPTKNKTKKTKHQEEIEMAFRRRLNRNIKERQVLLHKTSFICLFARTQNYNSLLNNPLLMQNVLKILPSKNAYPSEKGTEEKYFQSFVTWYKTAIKIANKTQYPQKVGKKKSSIKQEFLDQIKKKEARCWQDFIFIFVILCRGMGFQCRLVANLQPMPLKPNPSDLLPIKLKKEDDKKKDSGNRKSDSKSANKSSKSKQNASSSSKSSNKKKDSDSSREKKDTKSRKRNAKSKKDDSEEEDSEEDDDFYEEISEPIERVERPRRATRNPNSANNSLNKSTQDSEAEDEGMIEEVLEEKSSKITKTTRAQATKKAPSKNPKSANTSLNKSTQDSEPEDEEMMEEVLEEKSSKITKAAAPKVTKKATSRNPKSANTSLNKSIQDSEAEDEEMMEEVLEEKSSKISKLAGSKTNKKALINTQANEPDESSNPKAKPSASKNPPKRPASRSSTKKSPLESENQSLNALGSEKAFEETKAKAKPLKLSRIRGRKNANLDLDSSKEFIEDSEEKFQGFKTTRSTRSRSRPLEKDVADALESLPSTSKQAAEKRKNFANNRANTSGSSSSKDKPNLSKLSRKRKSPNDDDENENSSPALAANKSLLNQTGFQGFSDISLCEGFSDLDDNKFSSPKAPSILQENASFKSSSPKFAQPKIPKIPKTKVIPPSPRGRRSSSLKNANSKENKEITNTRSPNTSPQIKLDPNSKEEQNNLKKSSDRCLRSRSKSPKIKVDPSFLKIKANENKNNSDDENEENIFKADRCLRPRSVSPKLKQEPKDEKPSTSDSVETRRSRSHSPNINEDKENHKLNNGNENKKTSTKTSVMPRSTRSTRSSTANLALPQLDGADDSLSSAKENSKSKSSSKKPKLKKLNKSRSKETENSEEEFEPSSAKRPKAAPVLPKNVQQLRKDRRVLSTDNEADVTSQTKKKDAVDFWVEVWSEVEMQWIPIDLVKGKVNSVESIRKTTSSNLAYIFAFQNDLSIKDVTARYCPHWSTTVRKARIDKAWLDALITPHLGPRTERDIREDQELRRIHEEKPMPTSISDFKDHPLYALERHLLKFQALYPPELPPLGFIRNEAIYPRDCVHTLHSREIWLKSARVVKPGETPYKVVKARPKWDRMTQTVIKDQPLEIFGYWQTMDYDPPTAENGIVPRNAYGNVELFKECMLPKGCVHLRLPGLNRICRKLGIDCASAVNGFDFHSGACHPTYDGFVICEEFSEQVIDAWNRDQEAQERKEQEKYEARVYGNWKKLIRGLLIRERLKRKYNF